MSCPHNPSFYALFFFMEKACPHIWEDMEHVCTPYQCGTYCCWPLHPHPTIPSTHSTIITPTPFHRNLFLKILKFPSHTWVLLLPSNWKLSEDRIHRAAFSRKISRQSFGIWYPFTKPLSATWYCAIFSRVCVHQPLSLWIPSRGGGLQDCLYCAVQYGNCWPLKASQLY